MSPLRVGLVGAGPWAAMLHAPMLQRSPAVELAGIWARRPEAAQALAERRGTRAVPSFDALLDSVEAVAFAVPPDVQAEMAARAARAGRHLLLEKPLALDLDAASRLVDAIGQSGVRSQMVLTRRYMPSVKAFLAEASGFDAHGARAASISGAVREGNPFATPWRLAHGALLDVGPHVLDLLDASVGPIEEIQTWGDPLGFSVVTCTHRGGAVSSAALSITQVMEGSCWQLELFGPGGVLRLEEGPDAAEDYAAALRAIPEELAGIVATGEDHPLDARRGLYLQGLIERARRSLR